MYTVVVRSSYPDARRRSSRADAYLVCPRTLDDLWIKHVAPSMCALYGVARGHQCCVYPRGECVCVCVCVCERESDVELSLICHGNFDSIGASTEGLTPIHAHGGNTDIDAGTDQRWRTTTSLGPGRATRALLRTGPSTVHPGTFTTSGVRAAPLVRGQSQIHSQTYHMLLRKTLTY